MNQKEHAPLVAPTTFTLRSLTLGGVGTLREAYHAHDHPGENVSPQFYWENIPAGTQSLALTIHDADAPSGGSGWWHWLIFDIPVSCPYLEPGAGDVARGLAPAGSIQCKNDFGKYGYGGPHPPKGRGWHGYRITIYALDVPTLQKNKDSNPAKVGFEINQHCIEKASLIFYYQRS